MADKDIYNSGSKYLCYYAIITNSIGLFITLLIFFVCLGYLIKYQTEYDYYEVEVVNEPICDNISCTGINVKLNNGIEVTNLRADKTGIKKGQMIHSSVLKSNNAHVKLFDKSDNILKILIGISAFFSLVGIIIIILLVKYKNFCKFYGGVSLLSFIF